LGVKRSSREADHLPPSSAEVKECVELYSPNTPSWRGAQLKRRCDFTLPLSYTPFYVNKNNLLKASLRQLKTPRIHLEKEYVNMFLSLLFG